MAAAAGNWQLNRAHEKEGLERAFGRGSAGAPVELSGRPVRAEELHWRRVQVVGEYAPQAMVLLDNKVRGGVAGYEVIMPLRIDGSSMHVLVNRGWLAAGDRRQLPRVVTPGSRQTVSGLAVLPGRILELGRTDTTGPVWQNLTFQRYSERMKLAVLPVVIQQEGGADDGLQRSWPAPDFGVQKHYGYAVQWFLLCGLIVFLYVYFHVRRPRSKKNPEDALSSRGD